MKNIYFLLFTVIISFNAKGQIINVHNSNELQTALNNAQPGHIITLDNNKIYSVANCTNCVTNNGSGFKVPKGIHGMVNNPIKLVGNHTSIITSENIATKYGIHLQGNNYWVLQGFTVSNSSKCVMLDSSSYNKIDDLILKNSGFEALHLRKFSCFNTVSNCLIDSTGLDASASSNGFAEGIYVGSANSNWAAYSNGKIDTSDNNVITSNSFGSGIKSENIDVKEGTKGGEISFNTFNGMGCNGANSADSYLDMKGDYYTIKCNTSTINGSKILDGLQSHVNKITIVGGVSYNRVFGDYNIFSNNTIDMKGTTGTGYAINAEYRASASVIHNEVCNDNVVVNPATGGLSKTATVVCAKTICKIITQLESNEINDKNTIVSPNPFSEYLELKERSGNPFIKIQFLDTQGNVILEAPIVGLTNYTLNTYLISKGVYLLKIYYVNNSIEIRKAIKM
jgi:hypothetical protein